jgi:hypothetical protein
VKYVGLALAIVMVLGGGLLAAQGNGWMEGPFDAPVWGILGALVAGLGIALGFTVLRPKE